MDVTPNVIPSTATTSSVEAMKSLAVRPKARAGLVAFASGIGRVVASVLVAMWLPLVALGIQRDLQVLQSGRRPSSHVLHDFTRNALVPHVQAVAARGHVVDREAPVIPRLCVIPILHHEHVGDHPRMHVAVHAHEPRMIERVTLRLAAPAAKNAMMPATMRIANLPKPLHPRARSLL